jgi:hypothetical protein
MRQNHAIPGLNSGGKLALIFYSTLMRATNLQRMSDALVGAAAAVNAWAMAGLCKGFGGADAFCAIHLQNEWEYAFLSQNPGIGHARGVSKRAVAQMKLLVQPIKILNRS